MNQTTEQPSLPRPQREFSQDFVLWLVALTVATLVIVFAVERLNIFPGGLFYLNASDRIGFLIFPWIQAGFHTIANGLDMFSSGHIEALPGLPARVGLLVSVLLVLVFGPTLLFFGWKQRAEDRLSGTPLPTWRGSTITFVVGVIITASMAIPVIPGSIMQRVATHRLQEAQAVQENKDQIINEIDAVVIDAHEYRVLPKELQGGGGSYLGYKLAEKLANTPNATYTVTVTDNAVTIVATSRPYPGAKVTVQAVSSVLYPKEWSFTGLFE
jgi:hypothetical protein